MLKKLISLTEDVADKLSLEANQSAFVEALLRHRYGMDTPGLDYSSDRARTEVMQYLSTGTPQYPAEPAEQPLTRSEIQININGNPAKQCPNGHLYTTTACLECV